MSKQHPWTSPGDPIVPPSRAVEPVQILFEWDCLPLSFTFRDDNGQLQFAHSMTELDDIERYLVVPTTQAEIDSLSDNRIAILDVLQSNNARVLDLKWVAGEWRAVKAWRTKTSDVPADHLPEAGVLMNLERQA